MLNHRWIIFFTLAASSTLPMGCSKKSSTDEYIQPKLQALMAAQLSKNMPITFVYYQGTTEPDLSSGSVATPLYTFTVGSKISETKVKIVTGTATSFSISPSLPAGLSLDTTTGSITGTPTAAATLAAYTVTASNGTKTGTSALAFSVTASAALSCGTNSTTGLLGNYCASLSTYGLAPGVNPTTTNWDDLNSTSTTNDGALANFGYTTSSGWAGAGTTTDPYSLVLDGTDDKVDFASGLNSTDSGSVTFEVWAKPAAVSAARKPIISNSTLALGMEIEQSELAHLAGYTGGSTYSAAVLADSPWGYWKLDETSGATATDSSGNGRNGTYVNSPTLDQTSALTGDSGKSVLLTRTSSQYISFPALTATTGTLEMWVKWTSIATTAQRPFSKISNNNGGHGGILIANNDGMWVMANAAGSAVELSLAGERRASEWYHMVVVYSAASSALYINGALVRNGVNALINFSADTWCVGCPHNNLSFGAYLDAYVDEIAFYTTELTSAQVLSHYQAGTQTLIAPRPRAMVGTPYVESVLDDSPWGYWKLDEASGGIAIDSSGNNRHGRYINGPTLAQTSAVSGDGSGKAVTLAAASSQSIRMPKLTATSGTFEFWINPTTLPADQRVLGKLSNNTGAYGGGLKLNADGSLDVHNDVPTALSLAGAGTFVAGTWAHVAIVFDGTTATAYVNGVQKNTQTTPLRFGSGEDWSVGGLWHNLHGVYTNAKFDEVAFYTSQLTLARIQAHYNARTAPTCISSSGWSNNLWAQLASVFDVTGQTLTLYFNGASACTATGVGAVYNASTTTLRAGSNSDDRYWNGALQGIRVYNSAVSSTVVNGNHTGTKALFGQ